MSDKELSESAYGQEQYAQLERLSQIHEDAKTRLKTFNQLYPFDLDQAVFLYLSAVFAATDLSINQIQ